ncbi:MAG: DUF58 domain-containing protein [Desulfatibacillaceae bacterium]
MSLLVEPLRNLFIQRALKRKRLAFPVRLHSGRVYVFPTSQGFVFFAILLAMLLGSVNRNNNLGFILTFLLGGMAFVSIFHTFRNIHGITLVHARAKPVFAGQKATFDILVRAPGHERRACSFHFLNDEQVLLDLPGGRDTLVRVPHGTDRRGVLEPTLLYVSTNYPFGLFRGWSTLMVDATCLVYPRPVAGPMITSRGSAEEDSEGESGGPGVDDFAGLASYQPGDPMQRISWKAYSRGQGLYTKKFEGVKGTSIYFDPDALSGHDLEKKLSRISHMVLTAEAMRLSYGLRLGSTVIEPGSGGAHKRECLRRLALFGAKRGES